MCPPIQQAHSSVAFNELIIDSNISSAKMAELELVQQIKVMLQQEDTSYPCCGNYLSQFLEDIELLHDHLMQRQQDATKEVTEVEANGFFTTMRKDPSSTALQTLDEAHQDHQIAFATKSSLHPTLVCPPVDIDCRTKMCGWFYQVVDYCKLSRDTVQLCMYNLDRFLCLRPSYLQDRELYQLAAIACLYSSIKLHESAELDMNLLGLLCRECYGRKDIVSTELHILQTLGWKVHPPVYNWFVEHYVKLITLRSATNSSLRREDFKVLRALTSKQTELCTIDYTTSCATEKYKASEVALACLFNSMEAMSGGLSADAHEMERYVSDTLHAMSSEFSVPFSVERMRYLRAKIRNTFSVTFGCSMQSKAEEWMHDLSPVPSGSFSAVDKAGTDAEREVRQQGLRQQELAGEKTRIQRPAFCLTV